MAIVSLTSGQTSQVEAIRIDGRAGPLPVLRVGEVVRLAVRDVGDGGVGSIYLNGAVIRASLPSTALPGDLYSARLVEVGDQIVLKILAQEIAKPASGPQIAIDLATLLKTVTPALLGEAVDLLDTLRAAGNLGRTLEGVLSSLEGGSSPTAAPLRGSESELRLLLRGALEATTSGNLASYLAAKGEPGVQLRQFLARAGIAEGGLEIFLRDLLSVPEGQLAKAIGDRELLSLLERARGAGETALSTFTEPSALADPRTALTQLLGAAEGQFGESFRAGAKAIRALLDRSPQFLSPVFFTLREELSALRAQLAQGGVASLRTLTSIFGALQRELKESPKANGRAPLAAVVHDLEQLVTNSPMNHSSLDSLLSRVSALTDSALSPTARHELDRLASRLDQLGRVHDALSNLNPVMQALGEPAVILFPFLFQGLMFQSEVSVENHLFGKAKDGEGDEESTADREPFQRIQISVPLPGLGPVGVDVAMRPGEILLRLTVENAETKDFIEGELPALRQTLAENGYTKTDFVAEIGPVSGDVPWLTALRGSTSVVA